ncbi:MAG TPA: extracellular solute-binding protein [Candidatus Binatia bacterium]
MRLGLSLAILGFMLSAPNAAEAGWQEDWERVLKAAKQEGKVSVLGPREAQARDVLTEPFRKKYGIDVEFIGGSGREIAPRLTTERQASQYLWDVYVGGTTTGLTAIIPMGAADPVEPALILPEVKDPKYWRGGAHDFADPGRLQLVFSPYHRGTIFYNKNLVAAAEFKSHRDLLDPKWRGKMVMDDPRKPGPGQATFTFFYLHPQLGPDFIRALGKQEITNLRDFSQEVDAVGQGRYPVLIGASDATAKFRIKQGVPVDIVPATQLKEGTDVSPANGALILINRAPHPNAAKVFINWLLSAEAQNSFARAMAYVSGRLDVPAGHLEPWRIPLPGAIKTYDLEAIKAKGPLVEVLQEAFGR